MHYRRRDKQSYAREVPSLGLEEAPLREEIDLNMTNVTTENLESAVAQEARRRPPRRVAGKTTREGVVTSRARADTPLEPRLQKDQEPQEVQGTRCSEYSRLRR